MKKTGKEESVPQRVDSCFTSIWDAGGSEVPADCIALYSMLDGSFFVTHAACKAHD